MEEIPALLQTCLYLNQKTAINIQNELAPFTSIKRGVRQGCVLSSYLFNIQFISRESKDAYMCIKLNV